MALMVTCDVTRGDFPLEVQLTHDARNHCLDDNDNFSPDDQWLVYDTRTEAAGIRGGRSIEKVHVRTKEIVTLYQPRHVSETGPGMGAVSYHPTENRVVFIHGLLNHSVSQPYDFWRRFGMLVDESSASPPISIDARDVKFPFTPGALRGGTHRHEFSGDGNWIGFTYNDAIMAAKGPAFNLRTIGVTRLDQPVSIAGSHDGENFDGLGTSALVVRVNPQPEPGSDEISHAANDSWVGTQGYLKPDGTRQRARAFLGTVRTTADQEVKEIFVVDVPEDLSTPGEDGPLEGTRDLMPMPPQGASQRRLTDSTTSRFPGFVGNVRSAPDGSILSCLLKDEQGVSQIVVGSPVDGKVRSITTFESDVQSDVRWHPHGRHVCFVQQNTVVVANVSNGQFCRVTRESDATPSAPVWSRNGRAIAFNRNLHGPQSDETFAQVFIIQVEPDDLP